MRTGAAGGLELPAYPPELYDALESMMGQPLLWAEVVVVGGAGAARALAGRGARVRVVPLGEEPAHPDRGADLVAYPGTWPRTEPVGAGAAAARVLRPGGVLAAWWSLPAGTAGCPEESLRASGHFAHVVRLELPAPAPDDDQQAPEVVLLLAARAAAGPVA